MVSTKALLFFEATNFWPIVHTRRTVRIPQYNAHFYGMLFVFASFFLCKFGGFHRFCTLYRFIHWMSTIPMAALGALVMEISLTRWVIRPTVSYQLYLAITRLGDAPLGALSCPGRGYFHSWMILTPNPLLSFNNAWHVFWWRTEKRSGEQGAKSSPK